MDLEAILKDIKEVPPNHKAGFVNIIGRPNVGKSTLMNALVGERLAIITSKAQTTRHRIIGIVNGADFQIVYSDTPGIIEPKYKLQASMMRFVSSSMVDADVFLVIVDATTNEDIDLFADRLKRVTAPIIFLLNKTDLISDEETLLKLAAWQERIDVADYIPISALKKKNLDIVFNKILSYLPLSPPFYDKNDLTDRPERFFVSEIIREKIFLNYKQEIPYSVEVVVESYKVEKKMVRISATILTNRKTQKPILIGRGGSMLKKVGTQARLDIEKFIEQKVFLELYVKVKENWRDDDLLLKNFGYES